MKRSVLLLLMLIPCALWAQVRKVVMDTDGAFEVTVKVGEDAYVTINADGKIIDIEIDGMTSYDPGWNFDGKIKTAGNIRFDYFSDHDIPGRASRVRSVGDISIDYFTSGDIWGRSKKFPVLEIRHSTITTLPIYSRGPAN